MKQDEFEQLSKEINKGADIDADELAEALLYASDAWRESQVLTRSLCAGYRALQKDIARKNRTIEIANCMIASMRKELSRLREKIDEMNAEYVAPKCAAAEGNLATGAAGGTEYAKGI